MFEFAIRMEGNGHFAFPELSCNGFEAGADVHMNEWPKLFIMAIANPWTPMTSDPARPMIFANKSTDRMFLTVAISASFVLLLFSPYALNASGAGGQYSELVEQVDGDRIMTTVTDLQNFGSRIYNTTSMQNAGTYIHDRFAELGLWVYYQSFFVDGYPQRNVIAVLNGTNPDAPQYLFGAHYDSMTLAALGYESGNSTYAPGADDDASGVAATIELARVLHDKSFNSTVKFVAFGAEETGLNGSYEFVQKELADGVLYAGTAIMDMIGYRDTPRNEIFVFRESSKNQFAGLMQQVVIDYSIDLSLTTISGTLFSSSDHYPFWMAGYPSILIIEEITEGWPVNPYYHSENDTAVHLSQEQMTAVSKTLLGCLLELQSPEVEEKHNVEVLAVTALAVLAAVVIVSLFILRRGR